MDGKEMMGGQGQKEGTMGRLKAPGALAHPSTKQNKQQNKS